MPKQQPIYLREYDILSPGIRSQILEWKGASAEILKYVGIEHIEPQNCGKYTIVATAVKYLADIVRANDEVGPSSGQVERITLFDGSITFFRNNNLDGNPEVNYERSGRILAARNNSEIYLGLGGLAKLLFGRTSTDEGRNRRVNRILTGYVEQGEKERDVRILSRRISAF